jgi:anaerobic magnesium-protoporphyrin IX monomethyl ester cyclase
LSSRNILLIDPPFNRLFGEHNTLSIYSLAFAYLSESIIEKTDWQVRVLVADFHREHKGVGLWGLTHRGYQNYCSELRRPKGPVWTEIRQAIQDCNPAIIGISAKSQNFAAARIVARIAKEINPHVVVIVGGPHPTLDARDTLKCKEIDIAVRGEGERTIVELLEYFDRRRDRLDQISGIVFRKDGDLVATPPRELIENLDELPFAYEHVSETLINYRDFPPDAFRRIFAVRGCPNACFFCSSRNVWSRRVRFRTPARVVQDLRRMTGMPACNVR